MTQQYLELRSRFDGQPYEQPFAVTVGQLASVWYCTPRNVKLIVRKLAALGWIGWQPGRGRGHSSLLTLKADAGELLLEVARRKTDQGDVKDALELINRFGSFEVKDGYLDWLAGSMGYSTHSATECEQDVLRFPVFRTINTLDPGSVYYAFDSHMITQLFDTLVEYDAKRRQVKPGIAHCWECADNATEWVFHLRKSVPFHHGRELTSRDVVFSLERLWRSPDRHEPCWMFRDVAGIEALDRKTVRIRLKAPNHLFLRFLATTTASIVPEDAVLAAGADFARRPVGTGPFKLVRLDEGICVLEAFTAHFRGRPHLDRVEIVILPEPEQETERLKARDWTSFMLSHGGRQMSQDIAAPGGNPDWTGVDLVFSGCSLLVFNRRRQGPQSSDKFREAMDLIIDRELLIAELGDNRIYAAAGFRPNPAAKNPERRTPPVSRSDIEDLIRESGYGGETFRLCANPFHIEDGRWIAERCRTFGIRIELSVCRPSEMFDAGLMAAYDGLLFGVVLSNDEICELELYADPHYFRPAFDEATAEAIGRLSAAIMREPDDRVRRELLAALEDRMRRRRDILFLVHKKGTASYHTSLRGVSFNAYGWLDFRKVWFHPLRSASGGGLTV